MWKIEIEGKELLIHFYTRQSAINFAASLFGVDSDFRNWSWVGPEVLRFEYKLFKPTIQIIGI